MKTKLFTLLLAVAASIGTTFAWDYEWVQIGDLYYNLNASNRTAEVAGNSSVSGNIAIPTSVTYNAVPYSVTSIGGYAFSGYSSLTSITIPNSVTSIGEYAFYNCTGLTSIAIPNSVTSIGVGACAECTGLTAIDVAADNPNYCAEEGVLFSKDKTTLVAYPGGKQGAYSIPNSVTSIGGSAFDNCTGLTSVTIPNSVTSIGSSAFYSCSSLTSVTIPNSVTSIGDEAFAYCRGLTSATIPNSVTSIGSSAFQSCTGLTSIEIPNSVTSIGGSAFYNCTGLTSVTIPNSVTSIGSSAFYSCSSLTSPVYNAHVFAFMPTTYSGAYTIPDGIESIAGYAFYKCTGLTSVTIGNSVTSIGERAFRDCTGLTSVTIGNSVTSIGSSAFQSCTGLTSITIPNSVTSIGDYVFLDCRSLTSPVYNAHVFAYMPTSYSGAYTIPDGIKSISGGAFFGCTGLTSITIPNSVTSIGDWAFSGCTGLTSPVYNVHIFAFMPTSYSGAYTIPDGIESIAGAAFYDCSSLSSVTIPNSVTSIGEYAFNDCSGLTSVTIPEGVTSIGEGAFYGCSGLTSVTCFATTPPQFSIYDSLVSIKVFVGVDKSIPLYVPAGSVEAYQTADQWKDFINILPISSVVIPQYTVSLFTNNPSYGSVIGGGSFPQDTTITIAAIPNYGYHFVQWSDGNTENPRTIVIKKDIDLTAELAIDKSGVCGKDNVLIWTYEDKSQTLTISGRGELTENYTFGVEAPSQMKILVIGNDITAIGERAFYGKNTIHHLTIGGGITTIGDYAFAKCNKFDDITCYAEEEPVINATTFDNVGNKQYIYLFVPESRVRAYKRDTYWGEFDVQGLGAEKTETEEVNVTSTETTAAVTWPAVSDAVTYELVIKDKNGNVICTLIFNAQGQLTSIAFNAPSRDGAPQHTQTAGFSFTVTGLDSGTSYDLTITAKNSNGQVVDKKEVSFHTNWPTAIENLQVEGDQPVKVYHEGQVYILRGEKVYTLTGQEVR